MKAKKVVKNLLLELQKLFRLPKLKLQIVQHVIQF
jgi:hypothetical protein